MKALMFIAAFVVVAASDAYACSCLPSTVKQEIEWSDVVFTGKVVSVRYLDPKDSRPGEFEPRVVVTFDVTAHWKGDVKKTAMLHTYKHKSSCSGWRDFLVGNEYLVYASKRNADTWLGLKPVTIADVEIGTRPLAKGPDLPQAGSDILGTTVCSRTSEVDARARATDLRALGKGKIP